MVKVICQLCKIKIDKATAYKISKGGKKANLFNYYCNEQEHLVHEESKRKKVTCRNCNKIIFSDESFAVPKGERQAGHYCNEEEYIAIVASKVRKVSCRACQKKIPSDNAYKVLQGQKFAGYYCDETEYIAYKESKRKTTKCQLCGKEIFIDAAHKVEKPSGESMKNFYYCNKKDYEHYASELEKYHDTMLYLHTYILEYPEKQHLPPELNRQVKKLNDFYPYEVIKRTLEIHRNEINSLVKTKDFENDLHMIFYLMTVIKNKINDVYKAWKIERNQIQKSMKAESDWLFTDSIDISMNMPDVQITTPKKGIGSFLEEDEL